MNKIAAITITKDRLELTKNMIASLYSKTKVDYHLFVDNGSMDGTKQWLDDNGFDYFDLKENRGITYALSLAVNDIINDPVGYEFIVKIDNDIEVVTDDIINKMVRFYEQHGKNYVIAPVDLAIQPDFEPVILWEGIIGDYNVKKTSHTGGCFMMMPVEAAKQWLIKLPAGDLERGIFFQRINYQPLYLKDLYIRHMGLNKQVKDYIL